MAEIIHDGFAYAVPYQVGSFYMPKWDYFSCPAGQIWGTVATYGYAARFTGAGYIPICANATSAIKIFPGTRARIIVGMAVLRVNTNMNDLFQLVDGVSGTCQLQISATSNYMQAHRGSFGTFLGATALGSAPVGVWDYWEFDMTIHPSAGVVEIWKNNTRLLNLTGINTRQSANSYATYLYLGGGSGSNQNCFITDLYCIDDQAGNGPTARVGDSRMITLFPNGAGSSTQWTPSAGANYTCVDEVPPNDDTDYVESNTVGQKDRYALTDMPGSFAGTIFSATHGFRIKKTDAGVRTVKGNIRSGSSETAGADVNPGAAYGHYADTIWVDPAGAGALTPTIVNGLQIGPDVTV